MNRLVIGVVGGIILLMVLPTSIAIVLLGVGAFVVGFMGLNVFNFFLAPTHHTYEENTNERGKGADRGLTRADFRSDRGYEEHQLYEKYLEWEEEQKNIY